ncbi:MAG: hypothetical protein HC825_06275 [Oscillatoriales cyanobacterium RM1_1_9]|nr:hypothetical protein [Oscillatoriales cyanobacterium SM2_3_0]NJO45704.1 hypothetical protein [Oscillatoriales cyanobacterium RM2_1_1]NJO71393.1 hypothetical protein [Oscillatoriales cyanobacterium RM1_1_9]
MIRKPIDINTQTKPNMKNKAPGESSRSILRKSRKPLTTNSNPTIVRKPSMPTGNNIITAIRINSEFEESLFWAVNKNPSGVCSGGFNLGGE